MIIKILARIGNGLSGMRTVKRNQKESISRGLELEVGLSGMRMVE